ncbi:MAG: pyrroloquinoline quinone biosynthesis protein PqqC, partial [Candidatus Nitrosotenuis sp.]
MKSLSEKIDAIIEQKSLLKHPFYQMWSEGKLSQESLAGYSKEYFQMVKAIPLFVGHIAQLAPSNLVSEIRENQEEEAEHIQPWIGFATGLGVDYGEISNYGGLANTKEAVSELSGLITSLESGAAAMY